MRFRFIIFFHILCVLAVSGWAQTDTVYIQQAPLVIKKQIVVEISPNDSADVHYWFVAGGYAIGAYTGAKELDSTTMEREPLMVPFVSIGRKYKNWVFNIGMSKTFSGFKASTHTQILRSILVSAEHFDTTGSYLMNGQTYYSVDTVPAVYGQQNRDTSIYEKKTISYWQFPVKIGYQINYKKLYLLPQVGICYGISSQRQSSYRPELTLPKSYVALSLDINIGFQIVKRLSAETGLQYQRQVIHVNPYFSLTQYLGKIALKYMF